MPAKSWTLIDARKGVYASDFAVARKDAPGAGGDFSVRMRRLRGGLSDGVDVVEVDNGVCRFHVLPTRGMSVHRAWRGEMEIGWQSPVKGPVHPGFVSLFAPGGLGWLDGFDELLVRCGLESNGPPQFDDEGRLKHPLHGRIANQPAHRVDVTVDAEKGEIAVTGIVEESRLFHNKLRLSATIVTRLGESGFRVNDAVANFSTTPGELQLLYHVNFGPPLLEPDARVVAPVKTLTPQTENAAKGLGHWDTYTAPQPGFAEHVFLMELAGDKHGDTLALLRNARGDAGVSLRFNLEQLPRFTLWKSLEGHSDGYVTGLEPAVNYPNARKFEKEQGRVRTLRPGESVHCELGLEIHPDAAGIKRAEDEVAKLRPAEAKILNQPTKPWALATPK